MSITGTIVHRADIQFHQAADVLRPYVGCFWVVTAEPNATLRVVPDGTTALSSLLCARGPDWSLRGPLIQPDERQFTAPSTLIGVRLRPGVAFLLSGIAAYRTVGRRIGLRPMARFHELNAAVPVSRTPAEYIDILERFLIARLQSTSVHEVVASALHEIEQHHGYVRVPDLAARCHVSSRHLNRLMRTWVGYGPKCYASIVRFQAALKQIEHAPAQSGAALASETGYFDQAHLTLDLVRFSGATPRRLASHNVADFSKTACVDLP